MSSELEPSRVERQNFFFLIVQLVSRPSNTAKALKKREGEKKKNLGRFLYFMQEKKIFFFTITKISSKHTDPTVSLLNYIERVQPLTVSGAHQS